MGEFMMMHETSVIRMDTMRLRMSRTWNRHRLMMISRFEIRLRMIRLVCRRSIV